MIFFGQDRRLIHRSLSLTAAVRFQVQVRARRGFRPALERIENRTLLSGNIDTVESLAHLSSAPIQARIKPSLPQPPKVPTLVLNPLDDSSNPSHLAGQGQDI